MERKTNISAWQLRLFEGFDNDIIVMERDNEEVFDSAIHVFFEKTYYESYVSKAGKYEKHVYSYHEDKLGEVVNQIFDEGISGLVIHMGVDGDETKSILGDEKYIAAKELLVLKDVADSYHFMFIRALERCAKEEVIARLWTKDVFIIGQLPDFRVKPKEGEKPVFELMTMKRKKDGQNVTAQDYDYESLKVFLTADSAIRFNPDKKPINKYKLSLLSNLVRGKLQIIIEPHRNYWLEYDPANINLEGYLDIPRYNEEMVKERIREYMQMDRIYILLSPLHSDYRVSLGNPFLMKPDDKNIFMYIYEKYDDAVSYVIQNPTLLPVFDGAFPIGVLEQSDRLFNLETVLALASKLGVTGVNLDMDTTHAICCKMDYIRESAGYGLEADELLSEDELSKVMRIDNGEKQYRMPIVPFCNQKNDFMVSDERKAEIISHIDADGDNGFAYMSGCSVAEMMVVMREMSVRFDNARKAEDEENKAKYNRIMNLFTILLTEALCEKPFIYTLREANGDFTLKNNIPYLIVTNRYEAGRKGEGRLMPAGIDNDEFMAKLCETSKVAALTDGPSILCLTDTKLTSEVAKQWKKSAPVREELLIYLTQGCDLPYTEAEYYYKKLKSDSNIFMEFTSSVRNGEYPSIGMLTIKGHTAKELADKYGLSMPEAYDKLLMLKVIPEDDEADIDEAAKNTDEKKGIFGKIFKK